MAARPPNFITGDPAFAVDQDGVIVLWNPAAEVEFGLPASAAMGQRCWKLLQGKDVHGNRYCCERCPLREMASRNESIHGFDILFKTADKGFQQFALNSLLVFDHDGSRQLLHICHSDHESSVANGNGRGVSEHPEQSTHDTLTTKESEVLQHLVDGETTRKIANQMFISRSTVRNHIHHILKKLKVHTRLEAVVTAQRNDLI